MRLVLLALLLSMPRPIAAAPEVAASATGTWIWTGSKADRRPVTVRIVRGSYRIVRSDGPVLVSMRVRGHSLDPPTVRFAVEERDRVTISDVYPSSGLPSFKECLPPNDARGDFWASDAVIDAVIRAPALVPVEVEVMDPRPADEEAREVAVP